MLCQLIPTSGEERCLHICGPQSLQVTRISFSILLRLLICKLLACAVWSLSEPFHRITFPLQGHLAKIPHHNGNLRSLGCLGYQAEVLVCNR